MTHFHKPLTVLIATSLLVGPIVARADVWADYARSSMTPSFSWADKTSVATPRARDVTSSAIADVMRLEFRTAVNSKVLALEFSESRGSDNGAGDLATVSLVDEATPGLNRTLASAQIFHEFDGGARLGAGIVVAEQQFASFGLGSEQIDSADRARFLGQETASAAGVRLNFAQSWSDALSWQASLQSRIDMQPFQSYRGVFSDPGDFDVPAEAEVSARIAMSPSLGLTFGTQHVFYSELNAFSSYALPERFLSLLGDGTSPVFAWRNLTIYDVKLDYALGKSSRLDLRYSTQQQPEPSSSLLYNALRDEFTNRNFAVGISHEFQRAGEFRFAASHAPVEYFLGTSSSLGRSDVRGEQIEVEARWRVEF